MTVSFLEANLVETIYLLMSERRLLQRPMHKLVLIERLRSHLLPVVK